MKQLENTIGVALGFMAIVALVVALKAQGADTPAITVRLPAEQTVAVGALAEVQVYADIPVEQAVDRFRLKVSGTPTEMKLDNILIADRWKRHQSIVNRPQAVIISASTGEDVTLMGQGVQLATVYLEAKTVDRWGRQSRSYRVPHHSCSARNHAQGYCRKWRWSR